MTTSSPSSPRVELRFGDRAELERHWRDHLSQGAAWLAGRALDRGAACALVLIAPGGARLELTAHVVFADARGCGLALDDFGAALRDRLEALVQGGGGGEPPDASADDDGAVDDDDAVERDPAVRNVHARLRGLSPVEQTRVARDGETHERIVLERIYGKAVWAALLQNPRLSHPEVARIARMGALPRPLVEVIVGNAAWLKSPEVRRALLSNPRLAADQIPRVLRLLSKQELRLVPTQTAYPVSVREGARRLLRELLE
jgi:hypothetical protein